MAGIRRALRFALERWVQRGVVQQLLLMVLLIVLVAVAGGVAAWTFAPEPEPLPDSIWWAFLRITDPGYLGDDEGTALRTISTAVTVVGVVIFMGSLIAIMTQWLSRKIRDLESGLGPISMRSHVVILGWTNRTPETVRKLLEARGRLDRFLESNDVHRLRVVVLSDEVDAARRLELRDNLGESWSDGQIFLRTGSSLNREDLVRLDLLRATVIAIPGADHELGGAELADTRVVKTLLNLRAIFADASVDRLPRCVAEIRDANKVPIASQVLPDTSEIVASDRVISQIISQTLRHPGIAPVLLQLLSHREGDSIFLRKWPELAGGTIPELRSRFRHAVLLGAMSESGGRRRIHLDPTRAYTATSDDWLILLAKKYDDCVPEAADAVRDGTPRELTPWTSRPDPEVRLLVLGWSLKVRSLVGELRASTSQSVRVTIASNVPVKERQRALEPPEGTPPGHVTITHVRADYTFEPELVAVRPGDFDQVFMFASGAASSSEEADARTVLGYVLLRSVLERAERRPRVLVELLDPESPALFEDTADVLVATPQIVSHLLAHVSLRPELNSVLLELVGAGGAELSLVSAAELGLTDGDVDFDDVQAAAAARCCVALGARTDVPEELVLNPDRGRRWSFTESDSIVLLEGPSED